MVQFNLFKSMLKLQIEIRIPVIPVHQFLPAASADILRKAPLTPEKVAFAWRLAVGPAVDKATTIEFRGGVLYVRARDASWQREVERSAGMIRRDSTRCSGPSSERRRHPGLKFRGVASPTPYSCATQADPATGRRCRKPSSSPPFVRQRESFSAA